MARRNRVHWKRPADVSHLSDHELADLVRANREEGFRGLTRRHEPSVLERIYDVLRDPDLTDEVANLVWEKAFRALREDPPEKTPRNVGAWFRRIAYNAAIDEVRKKVGRKKPDLKKPGPVRPTTVPLDDAVDTGPLARGTEAFAAPVYGRGTAHEARRTEREIAVWEAMKQLSPEQHRCLYLHYFERMTGEEIAEFLDQPLGTVKSHIYRGQEHMREILEPQFSTLFSDSQPSDPFYTPRPDPRAWDWPPDPDGTPRTDQSPPPDAA